MKKDSDTWEMRKQYDFSGGIRGKYASRFRQRGERWEDLFKPAAAHDAQTWLSYSLLRVQQLEGALVTYLSLAWQESPENAGKKAAALVEKTTGKMWIRLLTELQQEGLKQADFEKRLRDVLNERSWLVHRSGFETEAALSNPTDAVALVERFERLAEEAGSLREQIQRLLDQRLHKLGLSSKEIEKRREDVIQRWRAA